MKIKEWTVDVYQAYSIALHGAMQHGIFSERRFRDKYPGPLTYAVAKAKIVIE